MTTAQASKTQDKAFLIAFVNSTFSSEGCTMKSPMLVKLIFANNLYFPYTHPRHVPLECCISLQISHSTSQLQHRHQPSQPQPSLKSWWVRELKALRRSCLAWTGTSPMSLSHVHTRWQDQGHPTTWSLGAGTCQSATEDLDYLQGSYRSETRQQNEPRVGIPQHPSDSVTAKLQPVLRDSVLAQQGSQQSALVC